MQPALLLNATYEPLSVVDWRKAITLALLGKAEILEEHDRRVRSPQATHALPSVLRLLRRVRVPRKPVQFTRLNVYRRDGFNCQYCGLRFAVSHLTFDHVFPRSRGGETSWTNIVTSCKDCNRTKGDKTPDEARMPLLKPPAEPRWSPFTASAADIHEHPENWKQYLWI